MIEIKHAIREMKNAFDVHISRLDNPDENQWAIKWSVETPQTEMQREKNEN